MVKSDAQLRLLSQFLPDPLGQELEAHARLAGLRAGQIIIGHQDTTTDVFVVLEGTLRIELHSLAGRDVILAEIGAGDLFGEFAALDEEPRSATVTAVTNCQLVILPGDVFRAAVMGNPGTAEWLARRLVGRIRLLTERVFELNTLAVRSRLHCELLRLSMERGIHDNQSMISPAPTHAQLASRIGTHREAVTREIQYLQKQGIIDQKGRELAVHDVAMLTDIIRAAAGEVDLLRRASLDDLD